MTDRPSHGLTRGQRAGRLVFALFDVPVVAVVGLGLLATRLPPGASWWVQLIAIGLPYATWVLAAATLLALALRWRSLVWVHLVLIGLVGLRLGLPARVASPEVRAGDLRLTTFNLPQSGPSERALRDSAEVFVADIEPDLLVLQDTWVESLQAVQINAVHVAAITERLPYRLELPGTFDAVEGRNVDEIGVPLLVRRESGVEVLEQESLVPPGDADVSIALRSRLRWDGRELVLYNVHVRSFGPVKPWEDPEFDWRRPSTWGRYRTLYRSVYEKREREVEAIAARIEQETLPVVIAGDFNSTVDNWTTRRLRQAGARRQDAFHVGNGLAWGRTYHAARPIVRIDYVFVDPALEVTSARVVDVGFSDHRPVVTTLRWADDAP